MWSKPTAVWMAHALVVGGGGFMVYSDDQILRAILFLALIAFRIFWTKHLIACAADAKFYEVLRLAAQRRGLSGR